MAMTAQPIKDAKQPPMHSESMMVSIGAGPQLHIKRFCRDRYAPGLPVFMLHGLVEDGRIFYSTQGRGLACYLAANGYDVYVADLRGKGKSWPSLGPKSKDGLHESINEDIPALLKAIVRKCGAQPQIWIGHAWGGVLMSSYFARYGEELCPVQAMVHFGSRRFVGDAGWLKSLALKGVWKFGLMSASRVLGYVPARELRLGTTNETRQQFSDVIRWMFDAAWLDRHDEFDYALAAQQRQFPPSLYFACENDRVYGCPNDVRYFISELGDHNGRLVLLSKRGGSLQDYGHIDMLSSGDAEADHFPLLVDWLDAQCQSYADDARPLQAAEA